MTIRTLDQSPAENSRPPARKPVAGLLARVFEIPAGRAGGDGSAASPSAAAHPAQAGVAPSSAGAARAPWTRPRLIATLAFAFGLALLVVVAALAFNTAMRAIRSSESLDHSRQILQGTRQFFNAMQEAESSQRAYLITGSDAYLDGYRASAEAVQQQLSNLRTLNADDSAQRARLVQLGHLVNDKFAELERTIELRRTHGFEAARNVVQTNAGLRTMAELRAVIGGLATDERAGFNSEIASIAVSARSSLWLNGSGLGLALILSIVGYVTLRYEVRHGERMFSELNHKSDLLKRSNAELERFAYVASHDLQEPLRMVSSYTQLLRRRYQGKLDAEADEFISYAVDGAKRMQALINDLLDYSRVTTRAQPPAPTDSGALVKDLLALVQLQLAETQGQVTIGSLPIVLADASQLRRVFQNLISNGLKFHAPERPPRIHVSAARDGAVATFSIRDNGIGIEPQFFDRLFQLFQRLHTREEYPGTGIGLAICKRIIEHHGGRIWVESEPGIGTTFHFTLPLVLQLESPP